MIAAMLLVGLGNLGIFMPSVAQVVTGNTIIRALRSHNAYVSPALIQAHHAAPGDVRRLDLVARSAWAKGVPEKFLLVKTYPASYSDAAATAHSVRTALRFSGTLILVSEQGMAIASNQLTPRERISILKTVESTCVTSSFTDCAIKAANWVVSLVTGGRRN